LESDEYDVIDDGFGNLFDGETHIGNVFYSHGILVITNQEYQLMFPLDNSPQPIEFKVQLIWGSDPETWTAFAAYINDEITPRTVQASPGIYLIPGETLPGDKVRIDEFSLSDSYPWAPSSRADIIIRKDDYDIKSSANTTNQTINCSAEWVSDLDSNSVDILVEGSSTALGYKTYVATVDTPFANGEIRVILNDNTNNNLSLNIAPNTGTSGVGFNVLDNSDDISTNIANDTSNTISYNITGIGGYNLSGTINSNENVTLVDTPKGNIQINVSSV